MDILEYRFAKILASSDDALALCVVAILSWIASSDGDVDDEEGKMLELFSTDSQEEGRVAIEVGHRGHPDGLRLACSVVPKMNSKQRDSLVGLAVAMSLSDGYLKPSESHILLFLADLTGVGFRRLNELFCDATGEDFPNIGDLSSASWWESRRPKPKQPATGTNAKRVEALAVLGLEPNASQADIKSAYHRLASIHHPDRFSSLGGEAVEAATRSFRRIKNAFDYLAAN